MPFWIETIEEPFAQEKRFPVYGFGDVYKLWEAAVMRVVQKFETKKPAVLFGARLIGSIVLEIMGAENVQGRSVRFYMIYSSILAVEKADHSYNA